MTQSQQFREFEVEEAYDIIAKHWTEFAKKVRPKCWVIGISGGVDSSVTAALAVKIFGKDNVLAVQLPCGVQHDIADSDYVIDFLKIKKVVVNIGEMFQGLQKEITEQGIELTDQAIINAPARLRMTSLFAVAQSVGGIVLNTCNISETCMGNDTLFGDSCGSYAPIKRLTKTEVIRLAEWLGLPDRIAHKVPIDGLQPYTDEDRLGVKYKDIDNFIRGIGYVDRIVAWKILDKFTKNAFKIKMITIEGPAFEHLQNRLLDELQ